MKTLIRDSHEIFIDNDDEERLLQFEKSFARWSVTNSNQKTKYVSAYDGIRRVYMHTLLIACPKNTLVDHINGNGLDNQKANLRISTRSQNGANRKTNFNSKTGYKGVITHPSYKNKYLAVIKVNGKQHRLGAFLTKEEAATAYNKAAIDIYGNYAQLNSI